ncbi:alpha/beta hydrolase family protein [Parafrankia elaeagni]|uniref:alpha/beta hydrolase family protein n=1 Tax=Parafrankia elaeagni TaxID=222534 RepID=UPI0005505EA4|nr:alpha/beta family hydrolase [Parafrankia elaeagni]
MRGKSHTHGEILTDVQPDHAMSLRSGSGDGEHGVALPVASVDVEPPVDVDGGRLRTVPARAAGLARPGATVVLLHGAGSGTDTPVLTALAGRLTAAGVRVAALEMPYRVAGRRAPDRPARLDAVLTAATEVLGRPAVLGLAGASMGSRVAVRCARAVGARAVLALGFPLLPPGGRPSRAPELAGAGVPVLVVQGERDAFGTPVPHPAPGPHPASPDPASPDPASPDPASSDPARAVSLHIVAGADHSFRVRLRDARTVDDVTAEAADVGATWLLGHLLTDGA